MTDPRQPATLPAAGARPSFNRQLVTALLVLLLGCLAGTGWLTYRLQRAEIASELWERQTRVVIQEFGDLLSSLKDAETGQRGFIITGKPDYLEPYQVSLSKIANSLADLRRLTADNLRQQQRLDILAPLVASRLAILKETIALRETQGFPVASAALMALQDKTIMDEIRALMAQAEADESQLLQERVATHAMDNHRMLQSVTLGSILAGLSLLLLFICLRWELVRRQRAETVLQLSEQRLRLATDAAELGIWSWQPDGESIRGENARAYAILGLPLTAAPLTAARFATEFVHPEDLTAFEQAIANTIQHGARFFYQGRFYRPDGTLRWVEFTGQPVPGTGGRSLRVLGTVQDITARKQTEQLEIQQAAELATLYATAPVGLFFYDTDLRYVRVNPAMAELNGLPAEQHIGRTLRELLTPELADDVEPQVRQVLETGRPLLNCEVHGATSPRSGEQQRHWLVSYYPLQAGDGTIMGVQGAVQEITERKKSEEALRLSEERLRLAAEAAHFGMYDRDLAGAYFHISAQIKHMLGYDPDAPLGHPQVMSHIHPDDRMAGVVAFQHACDPAGDGQLAVEQRIVRRDGAVRWIQSVGRVLCEDGVPRRSIGFWVDITERKRAEEALSQSEARFRALLNSGVVAIYSCDRAGKILEINRTAIDLWGREPRPGETDAQFRGSFNSQRSDGTRLPYAETWMTRVLNGEIVAARDQEVSNERPDGSRVRVIVNVVPVTNQQRELTGAMVCFYDITERSRLERETLEQAQALAELDRRKDEFLAMLGHELRNPLAAISNAVQLLHLQKSEEPLLLQGRSIIERQLGHLTHLVDDLLEVARINSGSVQLRQQTVNLSGIVERALETAQPMILQHRHQLTLALPPATIFLHADTVRLEQVLVNLLTNAAKYTDDGGRIEFSVEQEDDQVVIRVRDNGIGIEPALLPHIFDLFTQAERSLDRAQGGLGIGLCLVQRLVQLHGGSVQAHSVLGQGSEFVVRLPLLPAAPELPESPTAPTLPESSAPASDSAPPPEKASIGCRVLVVDDNVDAAQSMAKLLERTGHKTRLAYDGPSALQAALDYRPEVVLLDIGLPGLDGYQVAERIRQQDALKNIVLVALTGYGQDTDRQRSQEAGFDHHLVKPSDFNDIENILSGVASLRKA